MGAVVLVGIFREARAAEEVWNSTFEGSPANGDPISAGASKIRDTRENTRARLQVEHFVGGTIASEDDDNGLHRLGSARCYMTESAPTGLFDSHSGITLITDLTDLLPAGTGVGDLANTSTGAAGALAEDDVGQGRCWIDTDGADELTNDECDSVGAATQTVAHGSPAPACCLLVDEGTCNLDDNQMYIYRGVGGSPGTPPVSNTTDDGWQAVTSTKGSAESHAKEYSPNYLTNGDFEWNATDAGTACDSTTLPSQWDLVLTPTPFAYELAGTTEGLGCAVIVTGAGATLEGISQTFTSLQSDSTYRVTARVKATAGDSCRVTTGATAGVTNLSADTVTTAAYETVSGIFETTVGTVDVVTLSLLSVADGDVCTWDHIKVARETRPEVPDAGVIAVFDTLVEPDITDLVTCLNPQDPIDCCTGAGTGDCDIDTTFQVVPELSISFNPPTPGWIAEIHANVSIGCDGTCGLAATQNSGVSCEMWKDGSGVTGTAMLHLPQIASSGSNNPSDMSFLVSIDYVDINPVPGTDIVYQVACQEEGSNLLLYNWTSDDTNPSESNLWMMAYPPH